ncbi:MAG TPA: hypothetical protein VIT91_08235 [Chthoniobacterales bacterium]
MSDESILLILCTSFGWLLLLLLGLTGLFHLICIGLLKFDKIAWKKVDYVWIGVGALGLISTTADNRVLLATNSLDLATQRTTFALQYLRQSLVTDPPRYLCTKFVRSEFSPANFDGIQKQFDSACAWLKTAPKVLPDSDNPPFKPLNFADTNFPASVTDKTILDIVGGICMWFDEYENRRKALEKLQAQTKRREGEFIYRIMGPLLICIAIALRLTKVTGEIRLDRKPR